jgi:hypothetical protein
VSDEIQQGLPDRIRVVGEPAAEQVLQLVVEGTDPAGCPTVGFAADSALHDVTASLTRVQDL